MGKHRLLLTTLATPPYGAGAVPGVTEPPVTVACLLPTFCSNARRLLADFDEQHNATFHTEFRVLSATWWNVQRECPQAGPLLLPDSRFLRAADQLYVQNRSNCRYAAPSALLRGPGAGGSACHTVGHSTCDLRLSRTVYIKWFLVGMTDYDYVFFMVRATSG